MKKNKLDPYSKRLFSNQALLIERKTVNGKDKFYPKNDLTKLLCEISGTETLTMMQMHTIVDSGLFKIFERGTGYAQWDPSYVPNTKVCQ